VEWIYLAKNTDQWQALMKKENNFECTRNETVMAAKVHIDSFCVDHNMNLRVP
jgi:hypothetical protein